MLKQQCYPGAFKFAAWRLSDRKLAPTCGIRPCWSCCTLSAAMLVYIAFRFEWIYGVAAVIAVFHDTIITIGLFSHF